MASKNSATSARAAPSPETKNRSRPPNSARTFWKTSRSATARCAASRGDRAPPPARARERSSPRRAPSGRSPPSRPALARVLPHLRVDLLEDARDRADERRPDGAEVLDDLLDPAVHRGGEPDAELGGADHLPERRGRAAARRTAAAASGWSEDAGVLHRLRLRDPAGVRELDALRPPGRARGVDERGQRVAADRGGALLEGAGVRGVPGARPRLELGERDDPAVRRWPGRRTSPRGGALAARRGATRASPPARRSPRTRPPRASRRG